MPVFVITAPSGPVFEFLVLFAVILLGPVVVRRLGLPGLIGLVLGGYAIGPHGLGLIHAGNQTVPELGHLGLLYLMFVAGLELDLHVLREYRRAAVALGLLAFTIPFAAGLVVGWALGWSVPAMFLLGALLSSHTLIVYPTLRNAGLGDERSVATAVGATVLTDTLALVVLALVAGSQTAGGSLTTVLLEIAIGFAVLITVGLFALPRAVDAALRRSGSDRVARYVVIIVALLFMAVLAEVFGIEGIVGAFFAGLALNRLVPNNGPSMERVDFFGTAVFVPVFLVSIGLLLDPSVMFTREALTLAALICLAALGGKAAACWVAGALLHFTRRERVTMYVLTVPQAAATLAVTLIGFEIGVFGTSVVNAVLVLILVSIVTGAMAAERLVKSSGARSATQARRLGARVVVVSPATGPSDVAIRAAMLLARPDGGCSDLLLARTNGVSADAEHVRAVERRIYRHGFDGDVRVEVDDLPAAVTRALQAHEPSVVIIDAAGFEPGPSVVPTLIVDGSAVTLAGGTGGNGFEAEITRRLGVGGLNGVPVTTA
jgi:Kef-type K+ transport system membrane component KefB